MYEEKHYGTWETLIVPDRRKVIPVSLGKQQGEGGVNLR